jgi:hypothetical protein
MYLTLNAEMQVKVSIDVALTHFLRRNLNWGYAILLFVAHVRTKRFHPAIDQERLPER